MTRTLALPSAILAAAVIAAGCGSKSDAASSGDDVSQNVGGPPASATASTGSGSP